MLEHLFPIILLGDVLSAEHQHRARADGILRIPKTPAFGERSRRRRHEGLRALVVAERRGEGIGTPALVLDAVDPCGLEAPVGHLPEGRTHGIVGRLGSRLAVDVRLCGQGLHLSLLDQQADGGRAAEVSAVDHHAGRAFARSGEILEIGRRGLRGRELRAEPQFGIGLEIGHGIEAEALSAAREFVGERLDDEACGVAVFVPGAAIVSPVPAVARKGRRRLMLVVSARNRRAAYQEGGQQDAPKDSFVFHGSICFLCFSFMLPTNKCRLRA